MLAMCIVYVKENVWTQFFFIILNIFFETFFRQLQLLINW